jgi:hypothetical protein
MGAPVRPASNSTTQKTHCFVKSTSNDLTAVGITTCLPSELTSSLRIGEFPCRLLRTKNHLFASLRFPDFQRARGYKAQHFKTIAIRSELVSSLGRHVVIPTAVKSFEVDLTKQCFLRS